MRITGVLFEDKYTFYDHVSLISSFNEKCFTQRCIENHNTLFISTPPPPPKIMPFGRQSEKKFCRILQATDGNMAHAHRMLGN
jgi:hypothetical protein